MSSQTNKPNYKPSSTYQYITIIRRKMIFKINAGNDKDSFNVVVHRTLWQFIFDIKKYILWSRIPNINMSVKQ